MLILWQACSTLQYGMVPGTIRNYDLNFQCWSSKPKLGFRKISETTWNLQTDGRGGIQTKKIFWSRGVLLSYTTSRYFLELLYIIIC